MKIDALNLGHKTTFRWRIDKGPHKSIAWRQSRSRLMSIVPARQSADLFIPFAPPEPYEYQEPCIIDAPTWIAAKFDRRFAKKTARPPAGGLAFFRNAAVLSQGCIVTEGGHLVAETLTNTEDEREFWPLRRSEDYSRVEIDIGRRYVMDSHNEDVFVLIKQAYDSNYGHWLIECLPRAGIMSEIFESGKLKFVIREQKDAMRDVYFDSLRHFGIDEANIIEVDDRPRFFERLVYLLPMNSVPFVSVNPKSVATLQHIAAVDAQARTYKNRIYVSRNKSNTRLLINEDQIIDICRSFGFEVVFPELIPFEEKVKHFSGADLIVGTCGAGLANIAFSPRNATVIALTSEYLPDHFYWDLASAKDIKYVSIHGKSVGKDGPEDCVENARLDFSIDPDVFRSTLTSVLADRQKSDPTSPAGRAADVAIRP